MDAVQAAEAAINVSRAKPLRVDARYFLIDRDPSAVACLREMLRRRSNWASEKDVVQVIEGNFESHLGGIIQAITGRGRARRSIFVLDQYGYTAAPPGLLRRIFDNLPNAEVFLTVAVGWMAAYLPNLKAAATKLGISQDVLTRVAACGDDGPAIDDVELRPTLQRLQLLLKEAFTTETGSTYYTPFFIVSRESNRSYWFLHMANNARANDVMKVLHWKVENHFEHFGGPGLAMLGYDPQRDDSLTGQLPFRFDDPARERTCTTLSSSLAARIASDYPDGVPFDHLFEQLCNETPATKAMLADTVCDLCEARELQKTGGHGERRAPTTKPKGDDCIRVARQRTFFDGTAFPRHGGV